MALPTEARSDLLARFKHDEQCLRRLLSELHNSHCWLGFAKDKRSLSLILPEKQQWHRGWFSQNATEIHKPLFLEPSLPSGLPVYGKFAGQGRSNSIVLEPAKNKQQMPQQTGQVQKGPFGYSPVP